MNIINMIPTGVYAKLSRIKADLLFQLTSKKNKRGIFLHSMFRSGSTYLFKKFREDERFYCFYEPFHHQLYHLERENLAVFRYDREAAELMNHPYLDKPHFYEYIAAMKGDILSSYSPVIAYDDFSTIKHHALTYKYIRNLLQSSPGQATPVLQFNRSSLRIGWLRSYFSDSHHFYLLRPPRDQFESYCQAGKNSGNIFLAMNVYILLKNHTYGTFSEVYDAFSGEYNVTANLFYDLERISEAIDRIPLVTHYELFLHIWYASLVHGCQQADCIIEMNRLGADREYTAHITQKLSPFQSLDARMFDDAALKNYNSYSLTEKEMSAVEEKVEGLYRGSLGNVENRYLEK